KRLEILRELLPPISSVLVLAYLIDPIAAPQVKALEETAHTLGIKLRISDIRAPNDLPVAFDGAVKSGVEGVITTVASIFVVNHKLIVDLAGRHKLLGVYNDRLFAEVGGLMTYNAVRTEQFYRAAAYVDKILKGAKPADLPIEQPINFEFIINLKTAKALGLAVPPTMLA